MSTNDARIELARKAIFTDPDAGDNGTVIAIVDLLANLRHLCRVEGMDYDELDATAKMHYDAEVSGDD